jgi:hypothetical protein
MLVERHSKALASFQKRFTHDQIVGSFSSAGDLTTSSKWTAFENLFQNQGSWTNAIVLYVFGHAGRPVVLKFYSSVRVNEFNTGYV